MSADERTDREPVAQVERHKPNGTLLVQLMDGRSQFDHEFEMRFEVAERDRDER
jgi:hypothetical protein